MSKLRATWVIGCVLAAALTACCHKEETAISLKSPFDRYDHNRTRRLTVLDRKAIDAPDAGPAAQTHYFEIADYAPQGGQQFVVDFRHKDPAPTVPPSDNLPPALLLPTYPGVLLPLSNAPIANCGMCRSDRADLVDYLATGQSSQAGIQAPEMAGDLKRAERDFAPILALLSRADLPKLDEAALRKLVPQKDVAWAKVVSDTRYAVGAIGATLAFRYRCFWFVLYRYPPQQTGFTRLVVVSGPQPTDPADKAPDVSSC